LTTREYSPDEMAAFGDTSDHPDSDETIRALASRTAGSSIVWVGAGILVVLSVLEFALEKEMYVLGGLLIAYGLASTVAIQLAKDGTRTNMLAHIVGDFSGMPLVMKRLALAQFFSWSALFIMWINTTPVVGLNFFHAPDTTGPVYQEAGNWVGVLSA